MGTILNGRRVIDIEIANIELNDYPDFTNAFIISANWEDTGKPLTEDELDQLPAQELAFSNF